MLAMLAAMLVYFIRLDFTLTLFNLDFLERTREEASILLADVKLRLKNCIFIGFFMAYFSIGMPRFLVAVFLIF
jgi:hypothetical protein